MDSPILPAATRTVSSSRIMRVRSANSSYIAADPSEVISYIQDQEKRNFRLGVVLILVAIITWLLGLELANAVLKGDAFNKPYLMAVITGGGFLLNLVPELVSFLILPFYKPTKETKEDVASDSDSFDEESDSDGDPERNSLTDTVNSVDSSANENYGSVDDPSFDYLEKPDAFNEPTQLTRREFLTLSVQVALIYLIYNICIMLSLQYTSASNQTVLGATTSMFTLVIGLVLRVDSFTVKKCFCTCASLAGVLLINYSEAPPADPDNKYTPKNPRLGNLLALCGACCYAVYLLVMKMRCGTGQRATNERVLFGVVGLITLALGVPVLWAVDRAGIEPFDLPVGTDGAWIVALAGALFSVASDYITVLAMLLTSPLVASLSLTLAIPIAVFIDYVRGAGSGSSTMYGFGLVSILSSVVLINVNLTTAEVELAEDAVEVALEEAIVADEVLSPVLSPLLAAKSPRVRFLEQLSPRNLPFSRPSDKNAAPTPLREVTSLSLAGELEEEEDLDLEEASEPAFMVYGGVNHMYQVRQLGENERGRSRTRSDSV